MDYTIQAAKMFYGLPKKEVQRMVYHYAIACGSKTIPAAWEANKMATRDWYYAFMDRNPNLVLKAPEGMSIARIVAFNKVNVETFFKAYTLAMEKYTFSPDRIYNLDESSLSTVMKPVKVVCAKGLPVATQVTRERGDSMTFVGIINAVGQSIPPVFIIPRRRWTNTFMRNTTFGCNFILHPNGWMNGECFVKTLQHLHEKSGSSVDNKILLIMDNAECHMNIHVVEFAIRHGIVIVTLPPHTTDKLQPLDVSVFGPFKTFLRALLNNFALMHPNQHITVHQLPEFACEAWIKASTPSNILGGFKSTGIWPINENIFPEDAFVGAQVTERPAPPENFVVEVGPPNSEEGHSDGEDRQADDHDSQVGQDHPVYSSRPSDDLSPPVRGGEPTTSAFATPGPSTPSTSAPATLCPSTPSTSAPATPGPNTPSTSAPATPCPSTPSTSAPATPGPSTPSTSTPATLCPSTPSTSAPATPGHITPETIRPFPKAAPRPYGKGRKRVRACILTENEEAIQDLRVKAEKRQRSEEKKKASAEKKKNLTKKKSASRRKSVPEEEESEEEVDDVQMVLDDSSEYSMDELEDDDWTERSYPFASKPIEVRDFISL